MAAQQLVLVATDLGESADEAIRQAHGWAISAGAKLVVCFVVPQTIREQSLFPPAYEDDAVALLELERRATALVIERVSALTQRTEPEFDVIIEGGRADLGIVRIASEVDASVIVMGNRRSSELDRLLLGSVSERVVRYAHCTVLVARSHPMTNQILAATDLSDDALPAVTAAVEIVARRKANLTILHCLESPSSEGTADSSPPVIPHNARQSRAVAADKLKELTQRAAVGGSYEIVEGEPVAEIVRQAERLDADLIVVGTRGRTGLSRLAFGSVAETVARKASCSVLAVRHRDGDKSSSDGTPDLPPR